MSSDTSAPLMPAAVDLNTPPLDVKPRRSRPAKDADKRSVQPLRKSHRDLERPPFECIALVLQGGGALGAFQAGVYQAMAEANMHPDWVSGISVGAINAALIAGNAPQARLDKLRAFWEQVCTPRVPDFFGFAEPWLRGDLSRGFLNRLHASGALLNGTPGFFTPRLPPPYLYPPGTTEATSWYDTSSLRSTLENLVDFDRINASQMRFSVGAVNIRSGNFVYFDSTTHKIRPEHILASGALPPGFPAVEVDGEHYWDGGLVSNTPLQWVVQGDTRAGHARIPGRLVERARRDAERPEQRAGETKGDSVFEPDARQHRSVQEDPKRSRRAGEHLEKLPPELLDSEDGKLLKSVADHKVYQIVHLIYRSRNYEGQSKDYEFSRASMTDHWNAGYNDAMRTLRHPEALQRPTDRTGCATFDLAVNGRE